MNRTALSRRTFLTRSIQSVAAAGALTYSARSAENVAGANERIRMGIVGSGSHGTSLMSWVQHLSATENVEISAVCDIWNRRLEAAVAWASQETGRKPHACRKTAEVCELTDVDALIIATPDFQHAPQTRQAIEAGKHVYVEKPFGCDFQQIRQARDAAARSDRVVQIGTQRRSESVPWAARRFVRAGSLGKITFARVDHCMFHQRWRVPDSENALTERDTDWDEFLSYTPKVPFDARKYCEFRLFWPYSTGLFCQWMSHYVDLVNLILGETPRSVVASGGVYLWKDGRTNPDTASCLVEYPSGCQFSFHMRLGNFAHGRPLTFYGTHGTLELRAGMAFGEGGGGEVFQEPSDGPVPNFVIHADKRLPDRDKGGVILTTEPDGDHMVDFIRAMRNGTKPKSDVDSGFTHALATTMAGMSLRMGQRIDYDATTGRIRPREETYDRHQPATRPGQAPAVPTQPEDGGDR